MAPQKGTTPKGQKGQKRAAPASRPTEDEPAFKVLKQQGISKAKYNAIIDAIGNPLAESLTDECREMLKTAVVTSLCIAKDERHEIQTGLVEMIGEVINEVMGKLKGAADQESGKLAGVEQAHKVLTDAADGAGLALAGATEVVATRQTAFEGAQADTEAAEKSLAEKQAEQRKVEANIGEMTKEREAITSALSTDLATIVKGEGDGEPEPKHVHSLVALAKKLKLEEPLLEAMPNVLVKRPDARGSFDQIVINQLNECFSKRAKELDAELAAQAAPAQERAAAVGAAEAALTVSKGSQERAAEALREAEAKRDDAQTQRDAADAEVAKDLPGRKSATEASELKQYDVDAFWITQKHFEALRERLSKAATAAEAAAEAAADVALEASEGGA
jgi:uncharacterized phage infection (PIP) family protein YhgE